MNECEAILRKALAFERKYVENQKKNKLYCDSNSDSVLLSGISALIRSNINAAAIKRALRSRIRSES